MPVNVQFRYDLLDGQGAFDAIAYLFNEKENSDIAKMMPIGKFFPGIMGYEHMNAYGEEVKRHMHYNFIVPTDDVELVETWFSRCRKRLTREPDNQTRKGFYSLVIKRDVEDYQKWFRYPLKQYENFKDWKQHPFIPLPDDFEPERQWELAHEQWVHNRDFLSIRRKAEDKRQTTMVKLITLIETEKLTFKTDMEIFKFVIKYHKDNDHPCERFKIRGYVDTIALMTNLMTDEEYYEKCMR